MRPTPRRSSTKGQPTVILAKTVKGYGMGEAGEGQNITHQQKKMGRVASARASATASSIPLTDEQLEKIAVLRPRPRTARRSSICKKRRDALGGHLPARRARSRSRWRCRGWRRSRRSSRAPRAARSPPPWRSCASSTTLLRDKSIGKHMVPIVPDESRTFGMEGMFRQFGIFSQVGQLYRPQDADQLMFYKEDKSGPDPPGGHQRGRRHGARGSRPRPPTRRATCR